MTLPIKRLREICPSVDLRAYAIRCQARGGMQSAATIEEFRSQPDRAMLDATLAQFRGDVHTWQTKLNRAARIAPSDPRPAFVLLAHGLVGSIESLPSEQQADLRNRLDAQHRAALQALEAFQRQDFLSLRDFDSALAEFKPTDIGYTFAARMRLEWRLHPSSTLGQASYLEAVQIASEAAPVLGPEIFAHSHATACLLADQPFSCTVGGHIARSVHRCAC